MGERAERSSTGVGASGYCAASRGTQLLASAHTSASCLLDLMRNDEGRAPSLHWARALICRPRPPRASPVGAFLPFIRRLPLMHGRSILAVQPSRLARSVKLRPITRKTAIRIGDRDARPPKGAPRGTELKKKTKALLERLEDLQTRLYAESRRSLLVVLQGRDTCGKDGTIRRVFNAVNPQGCIVTGFKKPSELEMSHDYLWRVHHVVPPKGMIGIFNRSHYEDVLVVRVRGLVPRTVWAKQIGRAHV